MQSQELDGMSSGDAATYPEGVNGAALGGTMGAVLRRVVYLSSLKTQKSGGLVTKLFARFGCRGILLSLASAWRRKQQLCSSLKENLRTQDCSWSIYSACLTLAFGRMTSLRSATTSLLTSAAFGYLLQRGSGPLWVWLRQQRGFESLLRTRFMWVESPAMMEARIRLEHRLVLHPRRVRGAMSANAFGGRPWDSDLSEEEPEGMLVSSLKIVKAPRPWPTPEYSPAEWDHWEMQEKTMRYVTTRCYIGPSGLCYTTSTTMQSVTRYDALDWKYQVKIIRLYPEQAFNKLTEQEWTQVATEDDAPLMAGAISVFYGWQTKFHLARRWSMTESTYHYHRCPPHTSSLGLFQHPLFDATPALQPICLRGLSARPRMLPRGSLEELTSLALHHRTHQIPSDVQDDLIERMYRDEQGLTNW